MNNATAAVVPLGPNGTIALKVSASVGAPRTHTRVVVLGYLDDAVGDRFTPINGCAAFDTRPGNGATASFLGPRLAGGTTTYQIAGALPTTQGGNSGDCGVPVGASAVLINLVAIQPLQVGNFRAYATGTSPTGGVVNFAPVTPSLNNSNAVAVPLDADGRLDLGVNTRTNDGSDAVHARGVVLGYFVPSDG